MKKKVMALLAVFVLLCAFLTGCTEVYKVSNNISQEADNFNVTRKLTVFQLHQPASFQPQMFSLLLLPAGTGSAHRRSALARR